MDPRDDVSRQSTIPLYTAGAWTPSVINSPRLLTALATSTVVAMCYKLQIDDRVLDDGGRTMAKVQS